MLDATPFRPLGDETEHYWLVQRMARASGTDLVEASDTGALTQADWAGMVHRCRGCAWADGCQRWLSQPVDALREAPADCLNHDRFAALQARLGRASGAEKNRR